MNMPCQSLMIGLCVLFSSVAMGQAEECPVFSGSYRELSYEENLVVKQAGCREINLHRTNAHGDTLEVSYKTNGVRYLRGEEDQYKIFTTAYYLGMNNKLVIFDEAVPKQGHGTTYYRTVIYDVLDRDVNAYLKIWNSSTGKESIEMVYQYVRQ